QFNIYRRNSDTRVSVVEGAVQISASGLTALVHPAAPSRLEAGQQAEVKSGSTHQLARADIAQAVAWRARRLVFRGESLDEVAAEFNRYNALQIRLEGGARRKRLTAVFDAND